MKNNGKGISLILAILTLAILGYILFVSVYNQIIIQNEGFFYMLVFGGILVLAYILMSLVTKLFAISQEFEDNKTWLVIEIFTVIGLSVLCFVKSLRYQSSLPADDALYYRTAVVIVNGGLKNLGIDLIPQLLIRPTDYSFAQLVALVFRIFGENAALLPYIHIFLYAGCLFFVYRIVRRVAGRACGLASFAVGLLMPSQSFAVYTKDSELFFAFLFFLVYDLFTLIIYRKSEKAAGAVLLSLAMAVAGAFLLVSEPIALIAWVMFVVFIFTNSERKLISGLIVLIVTFVLWMGLLFGRSISMGQDFSQVLKGSLDRYVITLNVNTNQKIDFSEVISSFHSKFQSHERHIKDNFYFLTKKDGQSYSQLQAAWMSLGNQLLYMFLILLAIACVFYLLRHRDEKAEPHIIMLIVGMLMLFVSVGKEENTFYFVEIMIMIASMTLHYMYLNHHPELYELEMAEEENSEENEEEMSAEEQELFLERSRALIFDGENEELYQAIKKEELANSTKPQEADTHIPEETSEALEATLLSEEGEHIPKAGEPLISPLPLPKRHVHHKLDYEEDDEAEEIFDEDEDASDYETDSASEEELDSEEEDWDFDIDSDDFEDFDV